MKALRICLGFAGLSLVLANPQTRCYIKDGNAFCGEEGENARARDQEEIRQLIASQRNRGDPLDLPQVPKTIRYLIVKIGLTQHISFREMNPGSFRVVLLGGCTQIRLQHPQPETPMTKV